MSNRKELLAILKSGVNKRMSVGTSGDVTSNGKSCNQLNKCVESKEILSDRHFSLQTQSDQQNSEEDIKTVTKHKDDVCSNAVGGKKAVFVSSVYSDPGEVNYDNIESNNKSEWTKKTEEFLMKLKNMESYSTDEREITKSASIMIEDSDSCKNKRKSDPHSKFDISVSPHKKKPCERLSKSMKDFHLKRSDSRFKSGSSLNDVVSQQDILETLQALKKEVTKLEKKRFEMSSKSSKQTEKSMSTARQLEHEMKGQINELWKAIDEISGNAKHSQKEQHATGKIPDENMPKPELQSPKMDRMSYILKSSKPQIPPAVNKPPSQDKCQEFEAQYQAFLVETNIANENMKCDEVPSKDQSEMKDKGNPMAHAMSEGIKYATSMYLKAEYFYDGGNLWCQLCNTLHSNVREFSKHLHSEDHIQKYEDQKSSSDFTENRKGEINPKSAPARGDEFFKPVTAFQCSLCDTLLLNSNDLEKHFTGQDHNIKFKEFLDSNDDYEVPYLTHKMAIMLKKELSKDGRSGMTSS